jgi:predicted RecB family nuclease
MKISAELFDAFLKCPTKCWLRAAAEPSTGNAYAEWVKSKAASYRVSEAERLALEIPKDEFVVSPTVENLRSGKWLLATGMVTQAQQSSCALESELDAVARVPSERRGRQTQFIPIRFIFTNKLGKDEKLQLAFDAFVLSETLGRDVSLGNIIHGDDHATQKVKTSDLASEVRKRIETISGLLSSPSPPDLVLNRHCAECEFQARCWKIAIEKDDLSLLAGMSAKERQKFRNNGIFTVTQLAYTFRPRRRPRRMRDKCEKYHHSLKALAIREKKIHVVGSPELQIEGTPVYLDVEGLPDRDFYYLIGLRIGNGDFAVQHCLWADTVADEGKIWRNFLAILETVEKPVVIHYGSYETTFLKRMKERYGSLQGESVAASAIDSALNLVSVMFAKIYCPTFSNGLKDIGGWLGHVWTENNASGLSAIRWRHHWEQISDRSSKEALLRYNSEDCAALELVVNALLQVCHQPAQPVNNDRPALEVAHADNISARYTMWPKFASPIAAFESVNKAGRWDYQRHRVYVRTDQEVKRATIANKVRRKRIERINKEVRHDLKAVCPKCLEKTNAHTKRRTKTLYDVRFTQFGVSRWVVKYHIKDYQCRTCHRSFGTPNEFWKQGKYGRNLVAFVLFQVIELCIPQHTVAHSMNRLFGLGLAQCVVNYFKTSAARHYEQTRQEIMAAMVKGNLIHADET